MSYNALRHRSAQAAARGSCVLQPAQPKGQLRHVRLAVPPAALPGTTLALVLGFLPWTGCSQGGFYDTGVQGVHGSNCQAIYQPAAAAEARFAASLRGNSGSPASSSSSSSRPSATTAEQNANSHQPSSLTAAAAAAASASLEQQQQQRQDVSLSQQLHEVMPGAAKDLVRDILREDNRARTKQLVDDAWQTLE